MIPTSSQLLTSKILTNFPFIDTDFNSNNNFILIKFEKLLFFKKKERKKIMRKCMDQVIWSLLMDLLSKQVKTQHLESILAKN